MLPDILRNDHFDLASRDGSQYHPAGPNGIPIWTQAHFSLEGSIVATHRVSADGW